jgi:hypothetical protein
MDIGNYIRLLLPEHDTVIIPGLGAFISAYKPAQIDELSGEMMPPSREVSFEPRIRNNDGLLAGTIAREEGISLTQAYQELENEREEMIYQLDKGEKVILENLGVLYYNTDREISFSSSGKDNLLLDAYGLETASLEKEPEEIPDEEPHKEETAKKQEEKGAFEEEAPLVYAGASLRDTRVPPRKRNRAWWLLLFLIPVIGAAIYIFTKDTQEPPPTVDVRVEEPTPREIIPAADTTVTDTVPVQEEEVAVAAEEIIDSINVITPDTAKYYLIRGSYENFENANKFAHRLKRQGYEPFHLGKHGSFYLVGIDVYDNEIVAYGQQYNYLDKFPESGVWIFTPGKKNVLNQ